MLERLGEPLGVVTAIADQARGRRTFLGRADHAGTTPIEARADALVEAARFILHVRDCARGATVATVGAIEVEPNAPNVVPEQVIVSVDARSAHGGKLDALVDAIGFEVDWKSEPVPMGDAFAGRATGRAPARLRRRPRCDVRPERVDAVRALSERRRLAPSGRALERGRHRARRRCSDGGAQ